MGRTDDEMGCDGAVGGHEVVVSSCGKTVWVNSGVDGSCIGRFSKTFGVDVHTSGSAQMQGQGECLFCTHGEAKKDLWMRFRAEMLKHHGVALEESLVTW